MEKSNDIKASDLLERVRKNLRQQEGEPEPEVLTEEFILKHERDVDDQNKVNRERGELIKELFGTKDGDDEASLLEDYFETPTSVQTFHDDDDLPTVLEDALAEVQAEQTEDADRLAIDYNLISMFGMQDVEDEDEDKTSSAPQLQDDDDLPVNFVDYESSAQTRFFLNRFQKIYKNCKFRTIMLGILLVFTFLLENITLFTEEPVGFLSAQQHPTVYLWWGIQVLLLCTALTFNKIFVGLAKLFKGAPNVDSR